MLLAEVTSPGTGVGSIAGPIRVQADLPFSEIPGNASTSSATRTKGEDVNRLCLACVYLPEMTTPKQPGEDGRMSVTRPMSDTCEQGPHRFYLVAIR